MIHLEEVTKAYGTGDKRVEALRNINLQVKAGEIYGIIGRSGAGKSTLIRCINMLERPNSGTITVNRLNMTLMGERELRIARLQMGMIFQHFNLMKSRTVFGNICLPLEISGLSRGAIKEKVHPLLKLVDLSSHRHHYPSQLSGGQKQRVAIARALANSPKVLLCDEATSALDPRSTQTIFELLKSINREMGVTILLITHEMDVVKAICDKVAVIHKGELIEKGRVIDVFTEPKTKISRDFVKASSRMEIPRSLRRVLQPKSEGARATILRISYKGDSASQPIIGFLIQQYRLDVNIIQANIENIQNQTIGIMVVEIGGEPDSIRKGITFLERNQLHVEVLGYVQ